MSIANYWGFLGLLSVPAILFIHLYRRRFPPRTVAGLFLWAVPRKDATSGEHRERLPFSLSLLLQILAALLLCFLLLDPRPHSGANVRHDVFVLDNSASMMAVDEQGRSAKDKAIEFIKKRVHEGIGLPRASIILTGRRPRILGTTSLAEDELFAELKGYSPNLPTHSFAEAMDLASQIAGAAGEIFFLTDAVPAEGTVSENISVISFGAPAENVGFVHAFWSEGQQGMAVSVQVRNWSKDTKVVTVSVRADERETESKVLRIRPNGLERLELHPPPEIGALTLSLPDDRFKADNRVQLLRPYRKEILVAVELDQKLADPVNRALKLLPNVTMSSDVGNSDIAILPPERLLRSPTRTWQLVFGPFSARYRGEGEPVNLVGPFLMESKHPLLKGVSSNHQRKRDSGRLYDRGQSQESDSCRSHAASPIRSRGVPLPTVESQTTTSPRTPGLPVRITASI